MSFSSFLCHRTRRSRRESQDRKGRERTWVPREGRKAGRDGAQAAREGEGNWGKEPAREQAWQWTGWSTKGIGTGQRQGPIWTSSPGRERFELFLMNCLLVGWFVFHSVVRPYPVLWTELWEKILNELAFKWWKKQAFFVGEKSKWLIKINHTCFLANSFEIFRSPHLKPLPPPILLSSDENFSLFKLFQHSFKG